MIPMLYRYEFWAPYVSIAAGFDYAIQAGTTLSRTQGLTTANGDQYRSHWGWVTSLQVKQDIGEDLSVLLDLRYRKGLASAIQSSTVSFTSIGLGIVKNLSF